MNTARLGEKAARAAHACHFPRLTDRDHRRACVRVPADLSDPALKDAIQNVRSDTHPATYCVLGYEGKAKIVCKDVGEGKCFSCIDDMDDGQVSFALLRVANTRDQESKTVKFVFICYVGPSVGGMARGRVGTHKGDVMELVGQSHVDVQTDDKDDLTEAALTEKLKKASGANYDLGSNAGGKYESKAGDIQASARNNYKTLEKDSNIGPVVFDKYKKDKNAVTPMDLGGRAMVAPPTAAKKNIVVRDEATRQASDEVTRSRQATAAAAEQAKAAEAAAAAKAAEEAAAAKAAEEAAAAAAASEEVTPVPAPAAEDPAPEASEEPAAGDETPVPAN